MGIITRDAVAVAFLTPAAPAAGWSGGWRMRAPRVTCRAAPTFCRFALPREQLELASAAAALG